MAFGQKYVYTFGGVEVFYILAPAQKEAPMSKIFQTTKDISSVFPWADADTSLLLIAPPGSTCCHSNLSMYQRHY